jgi:hypothetical protein
MKSLFKSFLLASVLTLQTSAFAAYWLQGVVVEGESFRFCEVGNDSGAALYPLTLRYYVDSGNGRFAPYDIQNLGYGWPTLYGYEVRRFSFGGIENSVDGDLATNCSLLVDESFNQY